MRPLLGGGLPVRLRAWDGSEAGPVGAPEVELRSADAGRRLLRRPGELGAAQAYVAGELALPPDDCAAVDRALSHAWSVASDRTEAGLTPATLPRLLSATRGVLGATGLRLRDLRSAPPAPASQARLAGRLHSLRRDRSAIAHHYDLSNEFYELVLDPSMAYSCAWFTEPGQSLEEAQRAKLDLVCEKLRLEPGMRLLDVGCGWGSLSLHAAEHCGARVTGVTIAAEQKRFIDARIAERGLADVVEIRLQDYRDVPERDHFDAVGSLEMGEHVGEANYPAYSDVLRRTARPGARILVQQMSRRGRHPGGGPFVESFIAPDMHMRPLGDTVAHLERAGLEVLGTQGMREHYVWTVDGWIERFEKHEQDLLDLVGPEVVRVWRLYLAGGRLAFRHGRMGVDQVLAARP